jgi:uncharacterized membrane protein YhaH (DUF805 family)
MGFGESIRTVFGKYATFSGRARRSELWWWVLFVIIVSAVLAVIDTLLGWRFGSTTVTTTVNGVTTNSPGPKAGGVLESIWALVILLPGISVAVRRLHDTGKSGWWWWLNIICCIGGLILLIFYVQKSDPIENKYGPVPA